MTATNCMKDKDAKNRQLADKDTVKKGQQGNEKSQNSPNSSDGKTSQK